jgi:hypothetical protein
MSVDVSRSVPSAWSVDGVAGWEFAAGIAIVVVIAAVAIGLVLIRRRRAVPSDDPATEVEMPSQPDGGTAPDDGFDRD